MILISLNRNPEVMLVRSIKPTNKKAAQDSLEPSILICLSTELPISCVLHSFVCVSFLPVMHLYLTYHKTQYSDIFSKTLIPIQPNIVVLETRPPLLTPS